MSDKPEKKQLPEKRGEKPFKIFKGAEYHKPPDTDDNPPTPSPPAKKDSKKD